MRIRITALVFAVALGITAMTACTKQSDNENAGNTPSGASVAQAEKECCHENESCCRENSIEESDCCSGKENSENSCCDKENGKNDEKSDCCRDESKDFSSVPDCCGE